MPLTTLQTDALSVIAPNRSEASHFAGGLALNYRENSARFSHDFDIFHESAEAVADASEHDLESLRTAGFEVVKLRGDWESASTFRKASVTRDSESVEIDWVVDSPFRFFPVEPDPLLGWRLHLFDIATNKALALSARSETRDYVDIVTLDKTYPLPAIIWAACGKDEGFSPLLLLGMMRRFARITPGTLKEIQAWNFDPVELKKSWIEMSDRAETEITRVADEQPELPIGVAFVDADGRPGWIGDDASLLVHHPSVRGCWPTISDLE